MELRSGGSRLWTSVDLLCKLFAIDSEKETFAILSSYCGGGVCFCTLNPKLDFQP